jgi:uncharacterized protein YndB with AHSA1/START domain
MRGHIAAGTIVDVEPGKGVLFTWGWESEVTRRRVVRR